MTTSTLTSKGQITIPQPVRQALGLQAGDRLDFVPIEGGFKVVPLRGDVRALRGRAAGRSSKPVSIDDMNQAVLDEVAARHARALPPQRKR